MSQTVGLQIEKSRHLIEGLCKHVNKSKIVTKGCQKRCKFSFFVRLNKIL